MKSYCGHPLLYTKHFWIFFFYIHIVSLQLRSSHTAQTVYSQLASHGFYFDFFGFFGILRACAFSFSVCDGFVGVSNEKPNSNKTKPNKKKCMRARVYRDCIQFSEYISYIYIYAVDRLAVARPTDVQGQIHIWLFYIHIIHVDGCVPGRAIFVGPDAWWRRCLYTALWCTLILLSSSPIL